MYTNKARALEILAKNKGIEFIKRYYIDKFWNKSLHDFEKEEAKRVEKFLCKEKEHDFLYAYDCLETLGLSYSGCQYVASKGNYSLLLSFISWYRYFPDWKDCEKYCFDVLKQAESSLSESELLRLRRSRASRGY